MVISPSGETVFSGVFGDKEGNNAGMRRKVRNRETKRCVVKTNLTDFDVVHR